MQQLYQEWEGEDGEGEGEELGGEGDNSKTTSDEVSLNLTWNIWAIDTLREGILSTVEEIFSEMIGCIH